MSHWKQEVKGRVLIIKLNKSPLWIEIGFLEVDLKTHLHTLKQGKDTRDRHFGGNLAHCRRAYVCTWTIARTVFGEPTCTKRNRSNLGSSTLEKSRGDAKSGSRDKGCNNN